MARKRRLFEDSAAQAPMAIVTIIAISLSFFALFQDQSLPDQKYTDIVPGPQTETQLEPKDQGGFLSSVGKFLGCISVVTSLLQGQGIVCDATEDFLRDKLGDTTIGSVIITTADGIGEFVNILMRLLTFDIPGAPTAVKFMVGVPMSVGLLYSGLALFRGA